MGIRDSYPIGYTGSDMKLTTHLHLVPRLRMRGALHPLLQYVFMARCLIKQEIRVRDAVLI